MAPAQAMAPARVILVLLAAFSSGLSIRHPRDIGGGSPYSGASSSSFSSSGTKILPGPGGYGNLNAFAGTSNFGGVPQSQYRGDGGGGGQAQAPFGFPGFNPFVPQYGQAYPYAPFPSFGAPFDFVSFLNQYLQSVRSFQAQVEAQQAASSSGSYPTDTNEVGGNAIATYSPQGGYGSANVFPAPEGGLNNRFGNEGGAPQNSVGPVASVSGTFQPPGGTSYGVFSSSSSGSSDINGKKTSFKQSTVSINDNGKITTYTAHDP